MKEEKFNEELVELRIQEQAADKLSPATDIESTVSGHFYKNWFIAGTWVGWKLNWDGDEVHALDQSTALLKNKNVEQ